MENTLKKESLLKETQDASDRSQNRLKSEMPTNLSIDHSALLNFHVEIVQVGRVRNVGDDRRTLTDRSAFGPETNMHLYEIMDNNSQPPPPSYSNI